LHFAVVFLHNKTEIGIEGSRYLPTLTEADQTAGAAVGGGPLCALDVFPPLLTREDGEGRFRPDSFASARGAATVKLPLYPDADPPPVDQGTKTELGPAVRGPLDGGEVQALLVVPPDFLERLRTGERAGVAVLMRRGDDRSRLAAERLKKALD